MKLALLSIFLALPLLAGCGAVQTATPPAALAPGALNQFDQDSYKALLALQASLKSLNASYAANPAQLASLKPALDQAATDYNIAELAWQTYHAVATAANQTAVTNALNKVQTDIAKVTP